jgi:hypothetical protein
MGRSKPEDTFAPEEAQRRFEALLRAVLTTPPLRLKDVPRKRPQSKRKVEAAGDPPVADGKGRP